MPHPRARNKATRKRGFDQPGSPNFKPKDPAVKFSPKSIRGGTGGVGKGAFIKGKPVTERDFRRLKDRNVTKERERERVKAEAPSFAKGEGKFFQKDTDENLLSGGVSSAEPLALGLIGGGVGLAAKAGLKLGAGKAGTAVITRTPSLIKGGKEVASLTTQRAFVGRSASSGVDKIFHTTREVARRFRTNAKSQELTKGHLLKRGLQAAAVTFIAGAFGTYPFAAWAQQEVLSGLKINARDARQAGDFELAEEMIALRIEVSENPWWRDLPYKNVVSQFTKFFEADKLAIESERRLIAHERGELDFEGLSTGEKIEIRDAERDERFERR